MILHVLNTHKSLQGCWHKKLRQIQVRKCNTKQSKQWSKNKRHASKEQRLVWGTVPCNMQHCTPQGKIISTTILFHHTNIIKFIKWWTGIDTFMASILTGCVVKARQSEVAKKWRTHILIISEHFCRYPMHPIFVSLLTKNVSNLARGATLL